MRIRFRYLMAAGAAAALLGAPAAAADPTCTNTGGGDTVCSTPGDVQVSASPSVDDFTLPYWDEVWGGAYPGPYPVPYAEGSGEIGSPGHR